MTIIQRYAAQLKKNCTDPGVNEGELMFWRNKLFATTLIFVLPVIVLFLVPSIYWFARIGHYAVAVIYLLTVSSTVIAGFLTGIKLVHRKIIFIASFYLFSFGILYDAGINSPGLIYLLAACVLSILWFSTSYVYWPAWINTGISAVFGIMVAWGLLPDGDIRNYQAGQWAEVFSDLIIVSFLFAALIPRLLKSLEAALHKERLLKEELKEEVRASNETSSRLNEAQAIAMLGNWEVNLVNNTVYWSDEIYDILGINKGDAKPSQEGFIAFVHPDETEYIYSIINKGLQTLENLIFHFRFIRKDGAVRHGYNVWKFKFDDKGNAISLSGILQDVTQRKEAELKLKNSEAFSRGILNSLISNMAVIDQTGTIVDVNESWSLFSGRNGGTAADTGIGTNYFDVCERASIAGDEYAVKACQGIRDVMSDRKDVFYMEYPCHSPGMKQWFGMRAMKFEGNQSLAIIAHHDISDRKFAELENTRVSSDLIGRNKDLEQFAYIVSHNLRAPVANILGLVNVWDLPDLPAEDRKNLNQALFDSVNKLDDVVKDLNSILQLRGEITEKNEIITFSKVVEDIKVSIKSLIDMDVIDIQYDFSEAESISKVRGYMYSIFYNLITNSIKYRQPEVPCVIKLRSAIVDNKIELTFADNSLGIDLVKRRDQVFVLYKRFHTHVEGKGLGLFMVKTQVEKLGGKISVESEVNKGTVFTIKFDLV